jgi:hypothetical protein
MEYVFALIGVWACCCFYNRILDLEKQVAELRDLVSTKGN